MVSIRAAATAMAVAIATAAVAAVAGASPSAPAGQPSAGRGSATDQPPAATAPLPAVSEHPIDPAIVAAATSASGGRQEVVQLVHLAVLSGPLSLVTDHASIELRPVDSSRRTWRGDLPAVRVVDARGTHEGWTVSWALDEIVVDGLPHPTPPGWLRVAPAPPVVVDGDGAGLVQGRPHPPHRGGRPLFGAEAGWGGGTYEAAGAVTVRFPHAVRAGTVNVGLRFSVA